MTPDTTPQAAEAARLAEEALLWLEKVGYEVGASAFCRDAIDRLRDLASRADREAVSFKNFHRSLCARFGYTHDEKDWRRDLVSLEEHIARLVPAVEAKPTAAEVTGEADLHALIGRVSEIENAFIEEYELDDGEHAPHRPSEFESLLITDAIAGLHADEAWADAYHAWDIARRPMRAALATPSASPSEAQKAVAWRWRLVPFKNAPTWATNGDPELRWVMVPAGGKPPIEIEVTEECDGIEVQALYTHPSAGAGAEPQELPMLPREQVLLLADDTDLARDYNGDGDVQSTRREEADITDEVTAFAAAIQRAAAASWGIRLKEGA